VPIEPGTLVRLGNARAVIDSAGASAGDDASSQTGGPMDHVLRLVNLVAGSALPVFLLGESGVGKGWLAEEIHRQSPRSSRPFVSLNCAAMPESLLESELFGHERGAFTGAVTAKPGILEAADQGTVFLDEIGEAPASTQAKLLHVLERSEVMRLGATRPRPIDVRFLAATNRDLESATASGTFRRDLYFRLAGVPIHVPPLRERASEIGALARSFVAAECARSDRSPPEIPPETIARLSHHPWVGNIRELRNVLARATLVSRGSDVIRPEHILFDDAFLPAAPARPSRPPAAPPSSATAMPTSPRSLADHLRDVERDRIVDALERAGGHQGKAAEYLGISRRTLTNKLNELGLPRPRKRPAGGGP
jgi:transcriptional regulator with GAF, ATPase, and Fis domain